MNKAFAVLAAMAVVACAPAPQTADPDAISTPTTAAPAPLTTAQYRARTADNVFDPYDRENYPKLYARLGKPDPTQRIQELREAAARRALETGRCDHVELADVSDTRSTNTNLAVFVDCTNHERFYVSESDVATDRAVVANSDKTITAGIAIERCVAAAKDSTTFPALMDPHIWTGSSFTSHKTTGNARVTLDFDATNAFGAELPYTADCLFVAGNSTPELTIRPR